MERAAPPPLRQRDAGDMRPLHGPAPTVPPMPEALLSLAVGTLTPRQQHIVAILGETDTLSEAAEHLELAPSALSARLRGIADRLQLAGSSELVALARRHQVLDACAEAIYGLDGEGRCVFANRSAGELLGYAPAELVGRDIHALVHHTKRDGTPFAREDCPLTAAVTSRRPVSAEAELLWHRDGSEVWVAYTAVPTAQKDGPISAIVSMRDVTATVEAAESAQVSDQALALALEVTGSIAFDVDLATGTTLRSKNVDHLLDLALGPDPSERGTFLALVHPDDRTRLAACRGVPVGTVVHEEFRVVLPSGELRRFEGHARILAASNGHTRLLGIAVDVTDRHRQAAARQLVLDTSIDAFVASTPDGLISEWNAAAEALFGWPSDVAMGRSVIDLLVPERNREVVRARMAEIAAERADGPVSHGPMEMNVMRDDGSEVLVELTFTLLPAEVGGGSTAFIRDITSRKRLMRELARRATTDRLTGLPNRAILTDRLAQKLAQARHDRLLAVICVGVDHLNTLNTSLGFPVADDVLVAVAERLAAAVRPTDTLARFREDSFVVLREDTPEHEAMAIAEQLLHAAQRRVAVDGREVEVRASAGIAVASNAKGAPELVLRDANAAMQRAKDRGGGRAELVDATLHQRAVDRLDLETGLHRAIERGQLRLHWQPVVHLGSGQLVAAEALLRWQHPERGLILPGQFLAVAEQTGAIMGIGRWALDAACGQLAAWKAEGVPGLAELTIAVNLSGCQLAEPGFADVVGATLDAHGLDASQLCVEITETMLMDDPLATFTVRALHGLGVQIAIDDFGTGYSSLLSVRRLPVHLLKLDQAFVAGLGKREDDTAIVRATVGLAHALGLRAVAEGIQSREQVALLQGMGCDMGQGRLWSMPVPGDEFARLAADRHPAIAPPVATRGPARSWANAALRRERRRS